MTKEEVVRILKQQHTGVVATVSESGTPSAATVYYFVDDDFTIYFPTRATSRKYQNIQKNAAVAFTVSNDESMQTIQVEGTAAEVEEPESIARVIERLIEISVHNITATGRWLPPVKQLRDGHFAVIAISPTWIRTANFLESDSSTANPYTVVLNQ